MLKSFGSWCVAFICVAGLPLVAHADGISASGASEIARPATTLRMQVDITAEGKTIQDALAGLKAKREALKAQLGQLGSSPDSVSFTSLRLFTDQSEQARRMEMMMQARMNGGKPAKAKQEEKVTVAITAKAEWALKGDPDELLIQSYDLKKKLEASLKSKPAAGAAPTTNAAEEEEAAEEAATPPMGYDSGEVKPGTPVFLYVAKISRDERDKALADAMNKAREQATQTAKAAGVQLGALTQLSQQSRPSSSGSEYGYGPGMSRMMYQMMNGEAMLEGGTSEEAIGTDISSVKLVVTVSAVWSVK